MKAFMFVAILAVVAFIAMSPVAKAQAQSGSFSYDATIYSVPLTISLDNEVALYNNLRPGVCYTTVADNTAAGGGTGLTTGNITPIDATAAEDFVPAGISITGAPQAEVAVLFTLPSRLYPTDVGRGHIDMSYGSHSGAITLDQTVASSFFNPASGLTVTLDGTGLLSLLLGGDPCVSVDANDNGGGIIYSNQALVTAEYTGN